MRGLLIWLLTAGLLQLHAAGIIGVVVDEYNKPVKDVSVSINCGPEKFVLKVDSMGRFYAETHRRECVLAFKGKTHRFTTRRDRLTFLRIQTGPEGITIYSSTLFGNGQHLGLLRGELEGLPLERRLEKVLLLAPPIFDPAPYAAGLDVASGAGFQLEGLEAEAEEIKLFDLSDIEQLSVENLSPTPIQGQQLRIRLFSPTPHRSPRLQALFLYTGKNQELKEEGVAEKIDSVKEGSAGIALPFSSGKGWLWANFALRRSEKSYTAAQSLEERFTSARAVIPLGSSSFSAFLHQLRLKGDGLFREGGYWDDSSALYNNESTFTLAQGLLNLRLSRSYSFQLSAHSLRWKEEDRPVNCCQPAIYDDYYNSLSGAAPARKREGSQINLEGALVFEGRGIFSAFHNFSLAAFFKQRKVKEETHFPPFKQELYRGQPLYTWIFRDAVEDYTINQAALILSDEIFFRRSLLSFSLRSQLQWFSSQPTRAEGTAVDWAGENNLPPAENPSKKSNFLWLSFSPRFAFSYGLIPDGSLVLHLEAALYTSSIPDLFGKHLSTTYGYARFLWNDANGDGQVDQDEVQLASTWDPAGKDADALFNSKLSVPKTLELEAALQAQPYPYLTMQITLFYRELMDFYWEKPYILDINGNERLLQLEDWEQGGTAPSWAGGSGWWQLKEGYVLLGYSQITTRPSYSEKIKGFEASFIYRRKKLFLYGAFTLNRWKTHYAETIAIADPTNHFPAEMFSNRPAFLKPPEGDYLINTRWNGKLAISYLLADGLRLSALLFARDGYIIPVYYYDLENLRRGFNDHPLLLALPVGTFRLPTLWSLDLHIEKEIPMGPGRIKLLADVFNATNSHIALEKVADVTSAEFGRVRLWNRPRTFRLGVGYSF